MLAPKTDGRRVLRVDLDWETRKVLSMLAIGTEPIRQCNPNHVTPTPL